MLPEVSRTKTRSRGSCGRLRESERWRNQQQNVTVLAGVGSMGCAAVMPTSFPPTE
jgi:hypothetical protein